MTNEQYDQFFRWLGVWDVADRYMYIHEHDINTQSVEVLIERCSTGRILLAYESNPWQADTKQRLQTILDNCTGNVRVLSSDVMDLWNTDQRWIYFPRWIISQRWQTNHQTPFKPYRFGFLSGEVRFHRLFLHQHCCQFWTDRDAVAVHVKNIEHVRMIDDIDRYYDLPQSLIDDLPFVSVCANDNFEQQFALHASTAGDHSNAHNAYAAAIHIAGETSVSDDLVLLSEKTWKALRSQCLTITLGNTRTCHALTRMGFAVPEDIDRDLPLVQKVHFIAERVRDWDFDACQHLLDTHRREIEHNFNHFNGNGLIQLLHNHLRERLA